VVPPPIRSTYNCIYSIWYWSHRYCRYSCMRSWWWVGVPPETCRAVSRYNTLCNIASCWICIGIFLWCMDPWTLNFCNFYCSATCWYKCSTSNQCKSKLSHVLMQVSNICPNKCDCRRKSNLLMLLTSPLRCNAFPSIVRMSLYSHPVILAILHTWIFVVIALATNKHCKFVVTGQRRLEAGLLFPPSLEPLSVASV
jgi:hypothetical protein